MSAVPHLIIYSRPGCHLCDEMKAVVRCAAERVRFTWEDVDISTDDRLEQLYGTEIPVLMIGGRKAAKYRIGEEELVRRIKLRIDPLRSELKIDQLVD